MNWEEPLPDYLSERWVDVNGDGLLDYVEDVVVNQKTPTLYQNYINYGAPSYGELTNLETMLFYDLDYTAHCSSPDIGAFLGAFIWDSWGGFGDRWSWVGSFLTPPVPVCTYTVDSISGRMQFVTAEPGVYYQVQTRQSLSGGGWINQGAAILADPVTGVLTKIFGDWDGIELIPMLVRVVRITEPSVSVEGPTTIDVYCAELEFGCGNYPAPDRTLTATPNATGGSYQWSISAGQSKVSIVGSATGSSVTIRGIEASDAQNDVTMHLAYVLGSQTATINYQLTVSKPTAIAKQQGQLDPQPPFGQPYGYTRKYWYYVKDQFGSTMGEGICVSEQVLECSISHSFDIQLFTNWDSTDEDGKVVDELSIGLNGPIPSNFKWEHDQTVYAGGCQVADHILTFYSNDATVVDGDCQ